MTQFIVYWSHLLEHMKLFGVSVTGKGCSLQNTAGSHCGPTPTPQTPVQLLCLRRLFSCFCLIGCLVFHFLHSRIIHLEMKRSFWVYEQVMDECNQIFFVCLILWAYIVPHVITYRTDKNAMTLHYDLFRFLWWNSVYQSFPWMDGFQYTCICAYVLVLTYVCIHIWCLGNKAGCTVQYSQHFILECVLFRPTFSPSFVAFSVTLLQMWPVQCILCDSAPI